jgi:hypothetical protein
MGIRLAVLMMSLCLVAAACGDFEIEVDLNVDAGILPDGYGGVDGGQKADRADDKSTPADQGGDQAGLSNDDCAGAIEAGGGGVFSGDTCLASDTVDLICGASGRPEVFYTITVPPGEWSCWVRYFNEGLTVAYGIKEDDLCPDQPSACTGPTLPDPEGQGGILFGGGETGHTYWMAVEGTGAESCGHYTFTVECEELH